MRVKGGERLRGMTYSKKAQSQIITTVLIILLVLAAIVIVWQVVQSTITTASDQAEDQAKCIGVGVNTQYIGINTAENSHNFSVTRTSQGGVFKTSSAFVLEDKKRLDLNTTAHTLGGPSSGQFQIISNSLTEQLGSAIIKVNLTNGDPITGKTLEFGLIGDDVTCGDLAEYKA